MVDVELRRRLERYTGKPISLTVTDNRTLMRHSMLWRHWGSSSDDQLRSVTGP